MIAKHVPMKSQAKSSFSKLAEYITDKQDKTQRVGEVAITNCQAGTFEAALLEIEATQLINTRATSDKTFHMLISFRAGENPTPEVIREIESRMCEALGYSTHQRVSAVHRDTDNLHIHVAINKINPITGTYHEPFQFHRTMGDMCEKLEREFGLEADNHIANKRGAESRATDMERHAGIESLITWVRRECLEPMRQAGTWAELHQVMQDHGLTMKLHGNGFVLESDKGVRVKPSTIARDLSKPALESRLGSFVTPEGQGRAAAPSKKYEKPPRPMRVNTVELYAKYREAQASLTRTRNAQLQQAREQRDEAIKKARQAAKVRRGLAKLASDARTVRRTADRGIGKTLAKQNADQLKKSLQVIQAEYQSKKADLYAGKQRQTWADWLRSQALQGNAEALAALRSREAATGLKGATLSGTGQHQAAAPSAAVDGITKKGTIIYRAGASAIRDDGQRLEVSRQADQATIVEALKLAAQQLGPVLTVQGSAEFKAKAIRAAVDAGLAIQFSDPALEQRRISLTQQEKTNDTTSRPQPDAARIDGGRGPRHGAGLIQQRPLTNGYDAGRRSATGGNAQRGDTASKPNLGRVGRNPPPQSQNRLRNLSQLGLVRIASGTQVLLPGNVSGHMEQQGTQPAHALRRPVFGSGLTNAALAAADKYIAEREAKRAQGFDISKHIPYNHSSGELAFAGVRSVEGHTLVLLKLKDESLMVAPVDAATARRLSRLKLGDPVAVTERGGLKTTGRKHTQ
jgi:hypothetical protein